MRVAFAGVIQDLDHRMVRAASYEHIQRSFHWQ
jgi:hypothetical protein